MRIQLRGGHTTDDPRLDRIPYFDPRNANFPIREKLRAATVDVPLTTEKYWSPGPVTDQGREGACVGHGTTCEATASPSRLRLGSSFVSPHFTNEPSAFAQLIYKRAQKIDPWAGEDYEGTAVQAGVEVMRGLGVYSEYRWAFSLQDIRDTLIQHGPVILGINWYDSMYETRASGLVEVSGQIVGGHCITLTAYDRSRRLTGETTQELYRWQNSWGNDYGLQGRGWIKAKDLQRLVFDEGGEACVPVTRTLPSKTKQTLTL